MHEVPLFCIKYAYDTEPLVGSNSPLPHCVFQDKPYAVANNSVSYNLSNLILNGNTSCEQKTVI